MRTKYAHICAICLLAAFLIVNSSLAAETPKKSSSGWSIGPSTTKKTPEAAEGSKKTPEKIAASPGQKMQVLRESALDPAAPSPKDSAAAKFTPKQPGVVLAEDLAPGAKPKSTSKSKKKSLKKCELYAGVDFPFAIFPEHRALVSLVFNPAAGTVSGDLRSCLDRQYITVDSKKTAFKATAKLEGKIDKDGRFYAAVAPGSRVYIGREPMNSRPDLMLSSKDRISGRLSGEMTVVFDHYKGRFLALQP